MPTATTLAQLRRDRGWSQSQLVAKMRAVAAHDGEQLPDWEALRVQVSRWERGRHQPGDYYRRLLARVYEVGEHDLYPVPPASPERAHALGAQWRHRTRTLASRWMRWLAPAGGGDGPS